ncbi:MAG: hypothetical protein J6R47_03835 [Acholeplasmatales bacterium]|nr:hypothetical protein [Acholeplasmatales bacterium]
MKKKLLILFPVLMLALCLASCGNKLTDFQQLVKSIYDSEEALAGYNESNVIYDGEEEVYSKMTEFYIQRGQLTKSDVKITEKKLSTSGTQKYDITTTEYKTVDDVKYTTVNGVTYQNQYTMPTYYLTFVLSEEFLEEGFAFSKDDDNFSLSGKVFDNKISSLFLNKSLGNIKNLNIEIIVKACKLMSFKANYESENGFDVEITTSYLYAEVGTAKAVFYLEGGICQNSSNRVSYIYSFDGTMTDTLIVDPNVLETNPQDMILKNGYHIEGWYQTKIVNEDGSVTYKDKWDFATDKMTLEGVTLYANWEINRLYTYELYYYDNEGNEVFLDSYECKEGDKFYELLMDNREVEGHTVLGYLDENGKAWNSNFKHPGGDSDLAVKVYLELIEGEFTIVSTAKQLTRALSRNQSIYLVADIDLDGDEICYDEYSGTILGNGHTISNFEIDYDSARTALKGELDDLKGSKDHLYISLFFDLSNATIKDLTFSNAYVEVKTTLTQTKYIIVSPFAIMGSNVTLENVNFDGAIEVTKLPETECELEIVKDGFFYRASDDVKITNSSLTIED